MIRVLGLLNVPSLLFCIICWEPHGDQVNQTTDISVLLILIVNFKKWCFSPREECSFHCVRYGHHININYKALIIELVYFGAMTKYHPLN